MQQSCRETRLWQSWIGRRRGFRAAGVWGEAEGCTGGCWPRTRDWDDDREKSFVNKERREEKKRVQTQQPDTSQLLVLNEVKRAITGVGGQVGRVLNDKNKLMIQIQHNNSEDNHVNFVSFLGALHNCLVSKILYLRDVARLVHPELHHPNQPAPKSQNQQCNQVSPLVLIASGCSSSCFASTASFQPPYNWLTTALRLRTAFSFTTSEYMERSLSGSDSFWFVHIQKRGRERNRKKNYF